MSIFIYLIRGVSLLRYLIAPTYRRNTNARWKATQTHKVIYEVGTGVLGLVIIAVLLILGLRNLSE